MKNRVIAMLLALICVLGLFAAAPVYADEPGDPAEPTESAEPVDVPDPSEEPEETDPAESPDPSSDPEESAEPEESTEPEESAEPEPSVEPTPTPTPGPWYRDAINYAKENGLLKGDEKGRMNPNNSATRAEIATILRRVFQCEQGKDISHFPDVSTTAWYYPELAAAAMMDVMRGDAEFTMRPNAPIKRVEAFALIARAFCVPEGKASSLKAFSDSGDVASWAVKTIAGMVEADLIHGDRGALNPKGNITRAEFAQVLYNMQIQFCSEADKLPESGVVVYSGPSPLDITGFSGKLYLGGGKSMTVTGEAPEAEIIVRMEPKATVTMDGTADSVALYTRESVLRGAGSVNRAEQCAPGCTISLAAGSTASSYDAGLYGVQAKKPDPVPALTPENRSVSPAVTYSGSQPEGASNGERSCRIRWWIDGNRQPDRIITIKNGNVSSAFKVAESLWKRQMPSSHKVTVQLLYGTDCVRTEFTVPVKNYTDAEYQQIIANNRYPYQIEVVKNKCTVLIYGLDKQGNYSILHRSFVCSPGSPTPIGTFRTPAKWRWGELMGGVWGQYCTQITGGFLFHSVFYHSTDPSTLYYDAYNQLGTICSHGCVRVTVIDAKWMYDNCPVGTTVKIYNSDSLPIPKPTAQKIPYSSPYRGWDPTDPDPRNPWKK